MIQDLKEKLKEGQFSCVIENGCIKTFNRRGVIDLYELLTMEPDFLKGAIIADKVVGKAAAALMILGGVKELYTDKLSELALHLLQKTDIKFTYEVLVPYIINRTKDDMCPLEKRCKSIDNVEQILPVIESFLREVKMIK
jgi:hypothetical protein